MKTIATLIASLFVVSAFAAEPAKPAAPATPAVAATAPAAPTKCDPVKDKNCKVEKKAETAPVKSQAPAIKDAAKTAEPAKK